jgi:hypothetical protein
VNLTRKTAFAAAGMTVVTLLSATVAVARVMNLGVLGLGDREVVTTSETSSPDTAELPAEHVEDPAVRVVEQVIYEDVYERNPRSPARPVTEDRASAPPTSTTPPPTTPVPTVSTVTSTTTSVTTTRRPTTTTSVTTSRAATTTRPDPPAACTEPEWDREHQRWHCKGD